MQNYEGHLDNWSRYSCSPVVFLKSTRCSKVLVGIKCKVTNCLGALFRKNVIGFPGSWVSGNEMAEDWVITVYYTRCLKISALSVVALCPAVLCEVKWMAGMWRDSSLFDVGDRYKITGDWLYASWLSTWMFWMLPSSDLKLRNICKSLNPGAFR